MPGRKSTQMVVTMAVNEAVCQVRLTAYPEYANKKEGPSVETIAKCRRDMARAFNTMIAAMGKEDNDLPALFWTYDRTELFSTMAADRSDEMQVRGAARMAATLFKTNGYKTRAVIPSKKQLELPGTEHEQPSEPEPTPEPEQPPVAEPEQQELLGSDPNTLDDGEPEL